MASQLHIPTPNEDGLLQTDHSPTGIPGTAGISVVKNCDQSENYFQPVNDHETPHSEFTPVTAGPLSTVSSEDVAASDRLVSSQQILSPDVTISLQTCSSVSSYLTPRCDALLPETQSLSNSTYTFNTGNCSVPSELSSFPSPSYSSLLNTNPSLKIVSSPLLLPTLDVFSSPHSVETKGQLGQDTAHVSCSPCSDQPEDFEGTSSISSHQGTNSELGGESSVALEEEKFKDSIQRDAKDLEKYPEQDNMTCILDKGLIPGGDISYPLSSFSGAINPNSHENENTQQSAKTIPILPDLLSTEASLEMTSGPGKLSLVPDVSINHDKTEHKQPEVKPYTPTTMLGAKSASSADNVPVLYLQVTKMVKKEPQTTTDNNTFKEQTVSSKLIPNEADIATDVLKNEKNDDLKNLHEDQGHQVLDKNQNPHVMLGSTKPEQRNFEKPQTPTPTNNYPHVSPDPVAPVPAPQYTHWTSQAMSGSKFNNYYGSIYPDYRYSEPLFSDKYSLHYSRPQHAWMDLKGCWQQMGPEVQSYHQQNNQKEDSRLKRLEQSISEHIHSSDQLTSRQKRSKTRSTRPEQDNISPYWSENCAKPYNPEGWNPQGHYSSANYQGYYYPYNNRYKGEVSKSQSQQYNTNYDEWWRYDPRYESTFDHDNFTQYQQCYWDQCDRQSSHSGYSTQSMPSTCSSHSHFSWHSEQRWGYPSLQCTDLPTDDVNIQSAASSKGPDQIITSMQNFNVAYASKSPTIHEQLLLPHCCARFGTGGQLIQVLPNLPSDGKPALVQIHNIEMILQGCPNQLELQSFPGPLIKDKTHKSEVLDFVKKKHQECLQNDALADKEAACLIWELLELVCRQNGKLVGTDISHLLLRQLRSPSSSKKTTSDLIDFTHEALNNTLETPAHNAESATGEHLWIAPKDTEKDIQSFRELLIFGRKKDALETAISKGLWGHAFMLASKMDNIAYSQVMSSFIDTLSDNDALRTFYQVMSGRIPLSVTHCNVQEWGNWCIHLAMVLSNHTRFKHLHKKTIIKMAESLASSDHFDAATFCYMVIQLAVDTQSDTSDIFLFGTSPNFPPMQYATNVAIQRTEVFEYALSLGSISVCLPNFQIFKFFYACRLAEAGLCTQAFQYCEVISKALLSSGSGQSLTLINQLIELSAKMRQVDQQLKDITEHELEPEWMVNLRKLQCQMIEDLNSSSSKQHSNLLCPLETNFFPDQRAKAECESSQKACTLTTEVPKQESGPPEVHLVLPAPQDILENRSKTAHPKSSQVIDPKPSRLQPVLLSVSPISQDFSQQINPKFSSVEESVPAVEPQEVKLFAALRSERHDDADVLLEDQNCEGKDSAITMALPLPASPNLQPVCPVIPGTNILQSEATENIQPQSADMLPNSTEFTVVSDLLSCTMSPSPDSLSAESKSEPQLPAPRTAPHTVTSGLLPSSISVVKELASAPQLIASYIKSHALPSTESFATVPGLATSPHTDSSYLPSTLASSEWLGTEPEFVPHLTTQRREPHTLHSTVLPPSMSITTESESVAQLIEPYVQTFTLSSTVWPSSTSMTTEPKSVPHLTAPHLESHTLPSTMLSFSTSLAQESKAVPQLTALYTEAQTLPDKTLTSTMSSAKELEFMPQVTVPLPFLSSIQHCQKHSITQPSADVAPSLGASSSNHQVTEQNLQSHGQPTIFSSTSILTPQFLHPAVSIGRSQSSFTVESPTVPLLTVPLCDSQILPPNKSDYSTMDSKHVAQTESMPPKTSCLPDPVSNQKLPPVPSVNPYAMGQKIVHSKQMHTLSKPLIPRLFVPQSPLPDPQAKKQEDGGGWFSWLFGKKKEVQLPVDTNKSLVWDERLQRWIDPNEIKKKNKPVLECPKGVRRTTSASSGECDVPSTKGLLSAMPVLRSGSTRGYMAPFNPISMSNNPGTQLHASSCTTSTETQTIKPNNKHLIDPTFSGQSTESSQRSQAGPYFQTPMNLSQTQKSSTTGNVELCNSSQCSQDIL